MSKARGSVALNYLSSKCQVVVGSSSFRPVTGGWPPACLRDATASVETVSPPGLLILPRYACPNTREFHGNVGPIEPHVSAIVSRSSQLRTHPPRQLRVPNSSGCHAPLACPSWPWLLRTNSNPNSIYRSSIFWFLDRTVTNLQMEAVLPEYR